MSHIRLQHLYPPDSDPHCTGIQVYINDKRIYRINAINLLDKLGKPIQVFADEKHIDIQEAHVNDRILRWAEFEADVEYENIDRYGNRILSLKNVRRSE